MSLIFNTLSRFVIAFLPRGNRLLISWLQSPSAVILEPKKRKSVTASTLSPFICQEVMRLDAMILVFFMLSFKPAISLSSFTHIKRHFSFSLLSAIRVVPSAYLRLSLFLYFISRYNFSSCKEWMYQSALNTIVMCNIPLLNSIVQNKHFWFCLDLVQFFSRCLHVFLVKGICSISGSL